MKKFFALFFIFFNLSFLLISFIASADQSTISNYYPSPSGKYTKVHLVNQGGTSVTCNGSNGGTIFADPTTGYLEICKNDGTVASYPGSCLTRFGNTGTTPTCPRNYLAVNSTNPNFGSGGVVSWYCCFTGQGSTAGAAISKSGCFSIYATNSTPASCNSSSGDPNAYDVGCDSISSSDMSGTGPVYKRNCCFNDSLGANPLGVSSNCTCPNTCGTNDCGTDACGHGCGTCTSPQTCPSTGPGTCACTPTTPCGSNTCGTDSCGTACGTDRGNCLTGTCSNGVGSSGPPGTCGTTCGLATCAPNEICCTVTDDNSGLGNYSEPCGFTTRNPSGTCQVSCEHGMICPVDQVCTQSSPPSGSWSCTSVNCIPDCVGIPCGGPDGCGGQCSAGSCPSPETCGGGGTVNVCGAPSCPSSCSASNDNCSGCGQGYFCCCSGGSGYCSNNFSFCNGNGNQC